MTNKERVDSIDTNEMIDQSTVQKSEFVLQMHARSIPHTLTHIDRNLSSLELRYYAVQSRIILHVNTAAFHRTQGYRQYYSTIPV